MCVLYQNISLKPENTRI